MAESTDLSALFPALVPALTQALELLAAPDSGEEERLAGVEEFATLLADLWPVIGEQDQRLSGFLAYLEEIVGALGEEREGTAAAVVVVTELLGLLEAHVQETTASEIVEALLDMAQAPELPWPLPEAVAALWQETLEEEPSPEAAAESPEPPCAAPVAAAGEAPEPEAVPAEAAELLEILAGALDETRADLVDQIERLAGASETRVREAAVAACRAHLERFAEASTGVGLGGFAQVCAQLGAQLRQTGAAMPWPAARIETLARLPEGLRAYLEAPLPVAGRQALVSLLTDPSWPEALEAKAARELVERLRQDLLDLEPEEARPRQIEAGDLALTPAEEVDAPVLASFRREGPELVGRLNAILQEAPRGRVAVRDWQQAQRFAHTIKGAANLCGVRGIAVLSHHLEDLLEFFARHETSPGRPLAEVLVEAGDALEMMFDTLGGIEVYGSETFLPIMQQVLNWANRLDREGAAALDLETRPPAPGPAPEEQPPPSKSGAPEEEEAYLQVPARVIDDLLRFAGELLIALSQSAEGLHQVRQTLRELGEVEGLNLAHINELENLVDLRGLGIQSAPEILTAADRPESVPGEEGPDPLELEQYNEIYVTTRRLNEGVSDASAFTRHIEEHWHRLSDLEQRQARLTQEIRDLAFGTRLVPFQSVVSRLQRAVRQTCRATGKEAELEVQGGEVWIDGEVLDRLVPALMHVVRNAIDHGIEARESRLAAGKPAAGRLRLECRQLGNQLQVDFTDDGAGLDLARVRAKALAQGLISPETVLSDPELAQLTLRSGFSTREQVSQVSGRGVGMDVVDDSIRALNGRLRITTEPGQGYGLHLQMPATRLTLYCLLVRSGGQLFALQASEIRLALAPGDGRPRQTPDGWQLDYQEQSHPLVDLNALLELGPEELERPGRIVLLLPEASGDRAIMVDALLDAREIVVKKPGHHVPAIPGVLAATILGDGTVAPILDLRGLLHQDPARRESRPGRARAQPARPPTILVCDDSISVRRSLAQLVSDSGYRPLEARDGLDALHILRQEIPDVLLVDMEMPRMNGLELTAHLRAKPDTRTLPIAMITSRSTEKYRREARQAGVDAYFAKPYREEEIQDFIHQALHREPPATASNR